jgi:hypothetical protein
MIASLQKQVYDATEKVASDKKERDEWIRKNNEYLKEQKLENVNALPKSRKGEPRTESPFCYCPGKEAQRGNSASRDAASGGENIPPRCARSKGEPGHFPV